MLNLNLGSFLDVVTARDWLNIDILPLKDNLPVGVRFMQHDLRRGIPFTEGSVCLIRMSHLIEHIPLEEAQQLLTECHRVLMRSGLIRIATPDGKRIAQSYVDSRMRDYDCIQPPEYINARTQGEKMSRLMFSGDYAHRAIYDFDMLRDFMVGAGFLAHNVTLCSLGQSKAPEMIRAYPDQHTEVSLYVEGVK